MKEEARARRSFQNHSPNQIDTVKPKISKVDGFVLNLMDVYI